MRNYKARIVRVLKVKDKISEKEYCIPIRGESVEDVRDYLVNEFIPEMEQGKTSLCISNPNASYHVEKITPTTQG